MVTQITATDAPAVPQTPSAHPAASGPSPVEPSPAAATQPPNVGDIAWFAAIAAVKALVIALAVDAFANSSSPRYQGKGMKVRAVGYTGGLMVVPVAWRLLGRKAPYPRELDLAVALPLLADAGGNAVGIYQRAHVDDAIHFANGALLTSVVGALVSPRTKTSWEAAGIATAVGTSAAAGWEIAEWIGLKLGAKGMDLTYDDTMADLIETTAGAVLGGLVTLLRHPVRLRQLPGRGRDELVSHG
jgi:uncharacterized membrane protein YqgA involved in biofilm formation